jgi:hypothetical protein
LHLPSFVALQNWYSLGLNPGEHYVVRLLLF